MQAQEMKRLMAMTERLTPTQREAVVASLTSRIAHCEALVLVQARVGQTPVCPKCRAEKVVRNGQAKRPGALMIGATQYFARPADRRQIIELAARHRLPAMYEWREHVADGGLMTHSTSEVGLSQRLAAYIDRILKGASPGELPIERPTSFQFVLNLKTAKALGLTLPSSLMLRVDEVLE